MDPAIVLFGFGVGFPGRSRPRWAAVPDGRCASCFFGVKPMTAIGTDIFYAPSPRPPAAGSSPGLKTVNMLPSSGWPPGALPRRSQGRSLDLLKDRLGDKLDETVFAILASCLLVSAPSPCCAGSFLDMIHERDDFEIHTRYKIAAIAIAPPPASLSG